MPATHAIEGLSPLAPDTPCVRASIAPHCQRVKNMVSAERYGHIQRVAVLADHIARANDFSRDEIRATALAAILHDAARELKPDRMFQLAPPRNPLESAHPLTVHGRASRKIAELWGVTDERILGAIEGHVFGVDIGNRIGMAVYVADVSEPGRGVNADIRELAMSSVTSAYRKAVRAKVEYLQSVGKPVHPDTLGVYEAIRAAY